MTFSMVASVAALLLIVMLGIVIARLAGEVRRLGTHLDALTRSPVAPAEDPAARPSAPAPTAQTPRPTDDGEHGVDADEEVPVITAMHIRAVEEQAGLTAPRVASVTLAGPLIKVAALSHGVRRALDEERRMRIAYAMRKELRRQRKLRRRRRARRTPAEGWKP